MRLGLAPGRPALAAGLGLQVQRAELVEAEHDRLAGLRERVELDDPVALGLKVGIVGTLPGPHRLERRIETFFCRFTRKSTAPEARPSASGWRWASC
jgi:hypothetical protein